MADTDPIVEEHTAHDDANVGIVQASCQQPALIAPLWHTAVLLAAIAAVSIAGSFRSSPTPVASSAPQVLRYAISTAMEFLFVGWIFLGLRLRNVSFRSLFGVLPGSLDAFAKDCAVALIFWFFSMFVLGTVAVTWNTVQTAVYRHQQTTQQPGTAKPESPEQQQIEMARKLMQLAPSGGLQIAGWAMLCLAAGFCEELIFRGYLQTQGIALLRSVPLGMLISAIVFGAAHGYEGIRTMCLIAVYGALFSLLVRMRRSLFPGMLAHSWHDFATGMALALIRDLHLLDRLPHS